VLLVVVIIAVIVSDFNTKPDQRKDNPYEYDIDEYKSVDPELIAYKETKNIKLNCEEASAIYFKNNKLYLLVDASLQVLSPEGKQFFQKELPEKARTLVVAEGGDIFIAFKNYIGHYDQEGELIINWEALDEKAVITSLALKNETLYAADAGNRRVIRFSTAGILLGDFKGKDRHKQLHGFILPSPLFDLAVNESGELWVVNSGMHALENYEDDGNLRSFWSNSSIEIEGFSGCCNPAHMAILPDGSFITAEKGLVRIKKHKPSGEFESVVAAPNKFKEDGKAPDLAVSSEGVVFALDNDKKLIRIFEEK